MSAAFSLVQIEARGLPLTPESLASLPPFTSIAFNEEESSGQKSKPEVAKTGLGSSAAMTTAVVGALLHYLGVVNLPSEFSGPHEGDKVSADMDIVHILAQTAHCIAQGKVGSGFDVSSAVYGSQRYVRFSPEVISSAQVFIFQLLPNDSSPGLNLEMFHLGCYLFYGLLITSKENIDGLILTHVVKLCVLSVKSGLFIILRKILSFLSHEGVRGASIEVHVTYISQCTFFFLRSLKKKKHHYCAQTVLNNPRPCYLVIT